MKETRHLGDLLTEMKGDQEERIFLFFFPHRMKKGGVTLSKAPVSSAEEAAL